MKVLFNNDLKKKSVFERAKDFYNEMLWKTNRIRWILRRHYRLHSIIKNSYDFDPRAGVDMMVFHMREVGEFMTRENTNTVGAPERGKQALMWVEWINKVLDEEYATEYQDQIEKMYGRREMVFRKIPGSCTSSLDFEFVEKCYSEEDLKKIKEVEYKLLKKSQRRQEQEEVEAWKFFRKNWRSWWD